MGLFYKAKCIQRAWSALTVMRPTAINSMLKVMRCVLNAIKPRRSILPSITITLCGIGVARTDVAEIPHAVVVGVPLQDVPHAGAVVTEIA